MFDSVRAVEWVRAWVYELRWSPDYRGSPVRSREVASVAQLRAVVAWARRNPNVIKCSFHPADHLVGEPAEVCRRGHRLMTWPAGRGRAVWLACTGCPVHRLAVCPECGDRVIEPDPGFDCGPPAPDAATPRPTATGL